MIRGERTQAATTTTSTFASSATVALSASAALAVNGAALTASSSNAVAGTAVRRSSAVDDGTDDEASASSSVGSSSFSVGDFLLHALATGRVRRAAHHQRGGRVAAWIGLMLHRIDSRLRRDGEAVRDRIAMVGFLIVVPFITLAAIVWCAVMFAEAKFFAAVPPAIFVLFSLFFVAMVLCRAVAPRVGSLWIVFFFFFFFFSFFFFFVFRFSFV
jgi:hypothetical protein